MKRVQRILIGPFLVGNLDEVLFLLLRNQPAKHHVKELFDSRGQLTSLISRVKNSQLSANYANVT